MKLMNSIETMEILRDKFPKEIAKYQRTMNGYITSFEIEGLYNLLILETRSKDQLVFSWENQIIRILKIDESTLKP